LEIPLLGQIPLVESVREAGDAGTPPASARETATGKAFAQLAAATARQIAIRNSAQPPSEKVEMQVQ
jgi:ATP-binding protein involved in chromosome partitioning